MKTQNLALNIITITINITTTRGGLSVILKLKKEYETER